jgi:hypothetical protein
MTFTQYIENKTIDYKREWLDNTILKIRKRIESHLNGNRDRKLEEEMVQKRKTIMADQSDTIERFMNGILKVDLLAKALYEPNTRNIPKDKFVIDYLEDKGVVLEVGLNKGKEATFGLHQSLKNIKCKEYSIEFAIWSNKSNDAGISNKFKSLKRKLFTSPTILVVEGPKVKQKHLDSLKIKRNLKVMNIEKFIEWSKRN